MLVGPVIESLLELNLLYLTAYVHGLKDDEKLDATGYFNRCDSAGYILRFDTTKSGICEFPDQISSISRTARKGEGGAYILQLQQDQLHCPTIRTGA